MPTQANKTNYKAHSGQRYVEFYLQNYIQIRVVVMVVCNCNRLQLITNSYVIVILIVIDDNFV